VSYARTKHRNQRIDMHLYLIKDSVKRLKQNRVADIIECRQRLLRPELEARLTQENCLYESVMTLLKGKLSH